MQPACFTIAITLVCSVIACEREATPPAREPVVIAPPVDASILDAPANEIADAGNIIAEPPEASIATPPSTTPPWDHGSVKERLYALHVGEDTWAKRELLTWTTRGQVNAMRASHTLLVATADTRGPPSPFVWLVDARSRAPHDEDAAAIAAQLSKSARFARRRYAWSVGYATVLGLSSKRYGDELALVRLKENAWIVELAPEGHPTILVHDLNQREIPLDRVRAAPERIAAVYHVRTGNDVPARFREYVIVNEEQIESFEVGTPRLHAEVDSEMNLLRDLREELHVHPERLAAGPFAAWNQVSDDAGLRSLWQSTLAFENDRYQLEDARLVKAITALESYDREMPELTIGR